MANRMVKHVKHGDEVTGIIATPGTTNMRPRINGAKPIFKKAGIDFVEVGTSATGLARVRQDPSLIRRQQGREVHDDGRRGDSDAAAEFITNNHLKGKVGCPVGSRNPGDRRRRKRHHVAHDRPAAYLQGFLPIMQLFLYNISGGLIRPQDTDTGTAIMTKGLAGPYQKRSRWEGSSSKEGGLKPPRPSPSR